MKIFTAVLDNYTFAIHIEPRLIVAEDRNAVVELLLERYSWAHDGTWIIRELSLEKEGIFDVHLKFHELLTNPAQIIKVR